LKDRELKPPTPDIIDQVIKVGIGYDIHPLKEGIPLYIGGVRIPFPKGLEGHSDGDVLLHAISDALLGALSLPDIGQIFPPSSPEFKGISSSEILRKAGEMVREKGYSVEGIDSVVVAEEPKISPYKDKMKRKIGEILGIPPDYIGIKGKTAEGKGEVGRGFAIEAYAVCVLRRMDDKS